MTTYSISVQAAGCLPDSDIYPYTVDGLDAAVDAVMEELEWRASSREDVKRDLTAGVAAFEMEGTYTLEVLEV